MSQSNIDTVLTFINAMSNGDAETADSCVGPNAFTVAKGYGKFAGVRQRGVMVGTIAAFKQLLPGGLNVTINSVTAESDRVVVEFEGNSETSEGVPYHNQYCMVFIMEAGKIGQVNEYFCTMHADEVLWPLVARAVETE